MNWFKVALKISAPRCCSIAKNVLLAWEHLASLGQLVTPLPGGERRLKCIGHGPLCHKETTLLLLATSSALFAASLRQVAAISRALALANRRAACYHPGSRRINRAGRELHHSHTAESLVNLLAPFLANSIEVCFKDIYFKTK